MHMYHKLFSDTDFVEIFLVCRYINDSGLWTYEGCVNSVLILSLHKYFLVSQYFTDNVYVNMLLVVITVMIQFLWTQFWPCQ